jgi:glycosyltransferase involved in cell wall biosynthesis
MNKKVTFLINSLAGGGAEGVCVNVANGFAEQGWQVDLVILNLNNAVYRDRVSDKVNLVILNINHARYAGVPLLKYIRKNKPNQILVFNYELAVILVVLRGILRFKTKIIARNINTLSHKRQQDVGVWKKYVVKHLIDVFYCRVDHVINQCQAMREDLILLYPQLAEKSSVIYNPVANHIEEYTKLHDLSKVEKQDYLLCVGRLEKQKAFHYAIEGLADIVDNFPGLRLKIVGQGSMEAALKQCAKDFHVSDRVDFEGFQKDMIPYYLNAKITLLTSLCEGFPNVLIESISLGTPVIAFDCPSGPKEIVNEQNGILVRHLSQEDLINQLKVGLSDFINLDDIQLTAKKYSLNSILAQYSHLLEGIE